MDKLRDMAGDAMGLRDQLKDIQFPASKDQICSQLEQKGAPSQVVDKIRNADTSQFNSVDDVLNKVK